MSIELSKW